MYAGTELEIFPNFQEDYQLMNLQVTVSGADSVEIKVRTRRGRRYPRIAMETVSHIVQALVICANPTCFVAV